MRILLLNQFYPPDPAATGQLLQDVALGLLQAGHEVHVICSAGAYSGGSARTAAAPLPGLHIHRVAASSFGRTRAAGRLADWGSYFALALGHGLWLGRFDACLALTTPPFIGAVAGMLKTLRRTKVVLWSMDLWPEFGEMGGAIRAGSFNSRALHRLARWIYNQSDAVVSIGTAMTDRLAGYGLPRDKLTTVHNWVPAEAVQPRLRGQRSVGKCQTPDGRFVVMYSGNMGVAHEFDTILDAAALLQDDRDICFLFVGGGARRAEIAQGTEERRLGNVSFSEPRPLAELSGLLASADVHLVSMRPGWDGILLPSKLYGILAAGRPVLMVGPAGNDAAELVRESGAGFVIPNGEAQALVDAVRELRDGPRRAAKIGVAGRLHYERHMGRDRSVSRIAGVLQKVADGG